MSGMPFAVAKVALLLALLRPGATRASGVELLVSAAISLKAPLEELCALHKARGGVAIALNLAGSGELLRQIRAGAPVDVFIGASAREMDLAEAENLLQPGSRVDVASNRLVLITPADGLPLKGFADLRRADVTRVAMGNPATVPAGRYASELFAWHKLSPALEGKLILAENVRQVLDWVSRGEVDAGVVYATEARARSAEVRVVCQAPPGSHQAVRYPAACLRGSGREREARAFLALLTSKVGREVFARHGFLPPR